MLYNVFIIKSVKSLKSVIAYKIKFKSENKKAY